MKPLHLRTRIVLLISLIGFGIFLVLTGSVLTWYIRQQVILQLHQSNLRFTSVRFNLLMRSIEVTDLDWVAPTDSLMPDQEGRILVPHTAQIRYIQASGINFFQLVSKKRIRIRKITVEDGSVLFNQEFGFSRIDSISVPLSGIEIDRLIIRNMNLRITRDTLCEYSGNISLTLRSIGLEDFKNVSDLSAYNLKNLEAELKGIQIHKKGSPYTLSFDRAYFNDQQQKLNIDCLFLKPNYEKYEFSKAMCKQVTRMVLKIPQIEATGLTYGVQMTDSAIMAAKILIQNARLYAFRDKRVPFKQKENIPLPMELFRVMSMAIEIDTIQIKDAEITYEHFHEDGFRPGRLTFSNINALFENLNNREYYNKSQYATVKANSHLMGKGMLFTTILLPLGKNQDYHASGRIVNLPLHDLNPMLEHTAFLKIESGNLEELKFDFDFNEEGSKGALELNCNELRFLSLHKDRQGSVNQFKTMLVNTAIQNRKIREGSIDTQRDKKRYVFHLLAASLADGLMSSVGRKPAQKPEDK